MTGGTVEAGGGCWRIVQNGNVRFRPAGLPIRQGQRPDTSAARAGRYRSGDIHFEVIQGDFGIANGRIQDSPPVGAGPGCVSSPFGLALALDARRRVRQGVQPRHGDFDEDRRRWRNEEQNTSDHVDVCKTAGTARPDVCGYHMGPSVELEHLLM